MVDYCIGDRGGELGIRPGNQYGFGGSRSFPGGGFQVKSSQLHAKSTVGSNLDDGMASLGIFDWNERAGTDTASAATRQSAAVRSSQVTGDSVNSCCNGSGRPTSRLFSAYTRTSDETSCDEAAETPHVALHLVSKLLDDDSIATIGDAAAASSSQEEDDSVSPDSSDHGLPSPSTLASSWPGVLDFGHSFSQTPSSTDAPYSASPWGMSNSTSGHDVSQPAAPYNNGFLFLYESGVNGRQSAALPSPISPVAVPPAFSATGHEQHMPTAAHVPSQKGPASAPVPVQAQAKRAGRHPNSTTASAPRNISGKSEARRQRGYGRTRTSRAGDSYPSQDLGGSLPSSLSASIAHALPPPNADQSHRSAGGPDAFDPAAAAGSRAPCAQRKRRTHGTESRKCTPAVQQVHELVDKAVEHLASLDTERKEMEQSLNRFCPSRRSASNPSIRMPPNPSATDRIIVEQLRQHAKVDFLLSRIDRARPTPLHSTVGASVDSWLSCLNELQSLRRQQRQKQPKRGHSLADSDAADLTPLLKKLNELSGEVQSALCGAVKSSFDDIGPRTTSDSQTFTLRGVP
eukprot:scpid37715/ scgid16953/ Uncharacterized protein C17orf104 homolog